MLLRIGSARHGEDLSQSSRNGTGKWHSVIDIALHRGIGISLSIGGITFIRVQFESGVSAVEAPLGGIVKRFRYLTPVIVVVIAMCRIGIAQEVHTDHDKKASFSQYKTYYWEKVQTTNPLWQQRITDAVDKDLQAKGWQKVQSGGDVALTAVGSTKTEQEYQTFYTGLGPRWYWRGFGPDVTTTVQTYRVGMLVLDMYDAKTNRLIWRGTASDTLSSKPEKNENTLDKAVDKMFEKFPPEEKG
jgi:hypothetical protein